MKKNIIKSVTIAAILTISAVIYPVIDRGTNITSSLDTDKSIELSEKFQVNEDSPEADEESMEKMKQEYKDEYNRRTYYPETYPPSMELLNRLQNEADQMPKEEVDAAVSPWKCIGPFGFQIRNQGSTFHSGRARDLDYSSITGKLTVATGTGGIFRYQGLFPVTIGDNLPFCNINTIACQPNDTNIIFVGTGEEVEGNGRGLLRTTNSGLTWQVHNMAPGNETPPYIFKIRYNNLNNQLIYAATLNGLQRSTNGGNTWTMQLTGIVTDFVVNPLNNSIVYACIAGSPSASGIYISRNGGDNFTEFGSGSLPADNLWGNVKLAVSAADTSRIYISIAQTNGATQGAYRSLNSGVSWSGNINPDPFFHWNNQGLRNNAIGVSQVNADYVFLGGGPMIKSTNGGINWVTETTPNGHVDATRFVTLADGRIYWTHDGGISGSVTNGNTWSTAFLNQLPTVEFYNIAAPMNEKLFIAGGTQDNGTPVYDNTGNWYSGNGGDGAGVVFDPVNTNKMICFDWNHSGFAMHRHKSTDYFAANNSDFSSGIPANNYWWGIVRHDFTPAVYFYTNSGPYIYSSDNTMTSWTQLNGTAFSNEILDFSTTAFLSGSANIYACLNNPSPNSSSKLRVFDGTSWNERSSGLPSNRNIRFVGILKSDKNTGVAIVNGINSPGQKVFKTGNAGLNWINITGNLGDLPLNTVLIDQDIPSIIYIGTEGYGIFRTTDNGINWSAWNYGMPNNARVRELTCIDSTGLKFTVVAGTLGRSVFIRDAGDSDPVGISGNTNIVKDFKLAQNFPNPFNPSTKISFELPAEENVILKVYDITGREVKTLISQKMKAGVHEVTFEGSSLSSGVYFYRIEASRFTEVKKMILVK